MNRREFAAVAAGAALAGRAGLAQSPQFKKSICVGVFPRGTPLVESFKRAKSAGFDGLEIPVGGEIKLESTDAEVKTIAQAARDSGIMIVSAWASQALGENWLNNPDPAVRQKGVDGVKRTMEIARMLDCDAMLMVTGRLGSGVRFLVNYDDSWNRVTAEMQKLVPFASQAKVTMTPENVWNKWLVSSRDMRDFVDQFKSPWVGAHFDVGNIVQYGYPEDWIEVLGARIKRIHLKDYKMAAGAGQGRFVGLMEGDVNWKGVMAALVKAGYRGWLSPEYGPDPNDSDLKKMSETVDKIIALA